MQELRLVAVSEDGSYLVLATAGRGTRFTLPVDDRLRATVRGHFSRLGQYEIEVESPLRPKEIQARIRAGETAEEIAETAGIPVERVRWFEGPVLQEREYMAQQAQRVTIRRQGESAPAPALGEIVEERLGKRGIDLEEVEWDSRKCEDSTWRVRLSFSYDGRPYAAEWAYDPRRRNISAVNEEASRLSSLDLADAADDTVTPFLPRRTMKVVAEPAREDRAPRYAPAPAPQPREEPPAAEKAPFVQEIPKPEIPRPEAPRPEVPRPAAPRPETPRPETPRPAARYEAPIQEEAPELEIPEREAPKPAAAVETPPEVSRVKAPPNPQAPQALQAPPKPQVPPAAVRPTNAEPTRPAKAEPAQAEPAQAEPVQLEPAQPEPVQLEPAQPQPVQVEPAQPQPAQPQPAQPEPVRPAAHKPAAEQKPAEQPAEQPTEQPAAAAGNGKAAAQEKRPPARKKARGKRASVPSWDEIMFGARRPE